MNKKGKNKKGKLPNPNPVQEEKPVDKIEDLAVVGDKKDEGKVSETIQKSDEKIESVKEERVPEILSEIIVPPVETKDEETPKKPKRNRGKKKKGKEDFDDNIEEDSKEPDVQLPVEEVKGDNLELHKEPLDMPIVTPTARKKKNKKKNVEQKIQDPILPDPEQTLPLVTDTKDIIKEPEVTEIKQQDTSENPAIQPESVEQIKPSKKKNKKKKRNDSEKSDKEEISCTSAFQELINAKEEPLETKKDENIDSYVVPEESVEAETKILPQNESLLHDTIMDKDIIMPAVKTSVKDEEVQQVSVLESKSNKKKNKKDKKHIPKLDESFTMPQEPVIQLATLPIDTEIPAENIVKEEVSKDTVTVEILGSHAEETSPKPKAKIAKPVEKKRKAKQDSQTAESMPEENIIPEPIKLEQFPQGTPESPEIKLPEQQLTSNIETEKLHEDISMEIAAPTPTPDENKEISIQEFEPLNIPDKTVGKRRKKCPKIPKTPDVSFEILEPTIKSDIKESVDVTVESTIQSSISESMTVKEEYQGTTGETSELPINTDIPCLKPIIEPIKQTGIKDHVLLTPEITHETDPIKTELLIPETIEDKENFEIKSGKKRKKSPKLSIEAEVTPVIQEPVLQPSKFTEEAFLKPEATREMGEKIDASNITKLYDIEISSIKADEFEGSICDTIPDITYPRASSQQLLDDNNNNTVIREIFSGHETMQNIPTQECKTPEVDTISKGKEEVSPPKEEKTDIKSKMMEVNQDMEELRLSIERSLAELTAIEKSEELAEKQFEESKIVTEESLTKIIDVDVMQNKDDQYKNIHKVDTEKCTIEKPFEEMKTAEIIQEDDKKIEDMIIQTDSLPTSQGNITQEVTTSIQLEKEKQIEPKIDDNIAEITKEVTNVSTTLEAKLDPVPLVGIKDRLTGNLMTAATTIENKPFTKQEDTKEIPSIPVPFTLPEEKKPDQTETKKNETEMKPKEEVQHETPPVCPARKDHKGKHKKKKGKQDSQTTPQSQSAQGTASSQSSTTSTAQETKKEDKSKKGENKNAKDTKEKGKQQASNLNPVTEKDLFSDDVDYEPIDNFEDALTSSADDVNKTFEMILKESQEQSNPKINIIAPDEEKPPVAPPKNLLGHPDIPVPSSRRDYKKEKDKIPNEITAKVKIKDAVDVERKQSKNTQTISRLKDLKDFRLSDNEEFVYKYSFRKVFLQSSCNLCKKDLAGVRLACCYCNLVFYCGIKHKDEDWPQHQALCFAVSTIGHLKDQKHIYADAKNITGHDYRLIRMQMIVSCEKVLKRRLVPWEQEALLYPRICAHVPCREWRQMKLSDCQGCGQISSCTENPDHYPKSHSRWCKSYSLYQKLVSYQQTKGRLEPKLPTKVMRDQYVIPEKINEVLAGMYEEKIDMNDIQYAALTQLATAPLTAAYCYQLYKSKNITANGYKKTTFTIHVVGAELQFEADALNKWEVFFLHLRPDLQELKVVLINYNLNPSNLPLELLGKIKLCEHCRQIKRRVIFSFQDKRTYADYKSSEDFTVPDIVCAFNPSIQRSSVYNGKDPWPSTINVILKQKIPFIITAYTITELHKDCIRIKECSETGYNFISEPKNNNFASVRPDRNFISDDEIPMLFKNYCFAIICG